MECPECGSQFTASDINSRFYLQFSNDMTSIRVVCAKDHTRINTYRLMRENTPTAKQPRIESESRQPIESEINPED